jgi:transposase
LAFTDGTRRRVRTVPARSIEAVMAEIAATLAKWGLAGETKVLSCYEAGRDGFWIHRALLAQQIDSMVIDSSSIEVSRRARRAKTDRVDAEKLLDLLRRFHGGERRALRPVRVPDEIEEDLRRLHRERTHLLGVRTRESNRIKSLLALHGSVLQKIGLVSSDKIERLRDWQGHTLPPNLRAELERSYERYLQAHQQIKLLEETQAERLRAAANSGQGPYALMQLLLRLKGVGVQSAWQLVHELFGWRRFNNRRQLGACVGLTPTPFQSGNVQHEQGISKSGNGRIRALLIELAWSWLRHQPDSELSRWFQQRFGSGARNRKVGITALARRLVIDLWRMTKTGVVPAGALLKAAD